MIREFFEQGKSRLRAAYNAIRYACGRLFCLSCVNSCTEIGEVALEIVIVPIGEFHGFQKISG
jgi:hypothetical protein